MHSTSPGLYYLVTLYRCQFPWASVVSSDTRELDPETSEGHVSFENAMILRWKRGREYHNVRCVRQQE